MRLIGHLQNSDDARRFGDFLLTTGTANHVEEDSTGRWQVWVEHDDQLEQGINQLSLYVANPNDPRYAAAMSAAHKVRSADQKKAERRQNLFTDVRTSWAGLPLYPPLVTGAVLLICIVVAFASNLGSDSKGNLIQAMLFQPDAAYEQAYLRLTSKAVTESISEVVNPPGLTTTPTNVERQAMIDSLNRRVLQAVGNHPETMFSAIASGQVWRVISPIFVHFGIAHLIFNMMGLWQFGRMVESRKGPWLMVLLIVVSGVAGCLAQALWAVYNPFDNGGFSRFGGFSGVLYALFGYCWMKQKFQPSEKIGVEPFTFGLMIAWFFLCFLGFMPIANAAHTAGLLTGMLMGYAPFAMRRLKR